MKTIYVYLALLTSIFSILTLDSKAQQDSVYYLNGSDTVWFTIQDDVYAFALDDNSALNNVWPKNVVDTIIFTDDSTNYVYFNDSASVIDIDSVIMTIEGLPSFEQNYDAITQVMGSYYEGLFLKTYDVINVRFKPGTTESEIEDFADEYYLDWYYKPPTPLPVDEYYSLFRTLPIEGVYRSSLQVAVDVATHAGIVEFVKPAFGFQGELASIPNDTLYDDAWYFKNTGNIGCGSVTPVIGADMKMEQAWNRNNMYGYGASYDGSGVDIGIIDFYNFEWSHPDLQGQFKDGWDSHRNMPITGDFYNRYHNSHGTWVSSIAAGSGDNTSGSIGVAYGAKLRPYHGDWNDKRLIICLQQAIANDVDVLNMSFSLGSYTSQSAAKSAYPELFDLLDKCVSEGRDGKGMVIVAATGNPGYLQPLTTWSFPTASKDVLGVGASTSEDKIKVLGDGANISTPDWGSAQPPLIDVVAPGTCIWGADLKGINGSGPGAYRQSGGTSASAPIVAGLAALILEKNPYLKYYEVQNIIRNSTDQIGGYDYNVDPDRQGWSQEAGYGRINAYKAVHVNTPNVSIVEINKENSQLTVVNPVKNNLICWLDEEGEYEVKIVDAMGKVIYNQSHFIQHRLELSANFSRGIYWLVTTNAATKASFSSKVIKL